VHPVAAVPVPIHSSYGLPLRLRDPATCVRAGLPTQNINGPTSPALRSVWAARSPRPPRACRGTSGARSPGKGRWSIFGSW